MIDNFIFMAILSLILYALWREIDLVRKELDELRQAALKAISSRRKKMTRVREPELHEPITRGDEVRRNAQQRAQDGHGMDAVAVAMGLSVFIGLMLITAFVAYPNRPLAALQAHFLVLQAAIGVLTTLVIMLWNRRNRVLVTQESTTVTQLSKEDERMLEELREIRDELRGRAPSLSMLEVESIVSLAMREHKRFNEHGPAISEARIREIIEEHVLGEHRSS